jgi:hypothetical protein
MTSIHCKIKRKPATAEQKSTIVLKQSHKCNVCNHILDDLLQVDIDHVIPLWAGGADSPFNMQALHIICHRLKTKFESSLRSQSTKSVNTAVQNYICLQLAKFPMAMIPDVSVKKRKPNQEGHETSDTDKCHVFQAQQKVDRLPTEYDEKEDIDLSSLDDVQDSNTYDTNSVPTEKHQFPEFKRGQQPQQLAKWIIEHAIDNKEMMKYMHDSIKNGSCKCNKMHKAQAVQLVLQLRKDVKVTYGTKKKLLLVNTNTISFESILRSNSKDDEKRNIDTVVENCKVEEDTNIPEVNKVHCDPLADGKEHIPSNSNVQARTAAPPVELQTYQKKSTPSFSGGLPPLHHTTLKYGQKAEDLATYMLTHIDHPQLMKTIHEAVQNKVMSSKIETQALKLVAENGYDLKRIGHNNYLIKNGKSENV